MTVGNEDESKTEKFQSIRGAGGEGHSPSAPQSIFFGAFTTEIVLDFEFSSTIDT